MRIKQFNSFFNKICFVHLNDISILQNSINDIIDIFNSKHLLLSVVALDHNSEIFNNILIASETYQVILPSNNTITAETKIISTTEHMKPFLKPLINSIPRSITLYGFDNNIKKSKNILIQESIKNVGDNKLVIDNAVDFVLSIVLEEDFAMLSFNKFRFDHNFILKQIKQKFKNKK